MRHKGNKHRPSVPKMTPDVLEARRESRKNQQANRRRRRAQREAYDAAGDGIQLPDPETLAELADKVQPDFGSSGQGGE